jgi:hypothetical protein
VTVSTRLLMRGLAAVSLASAVVLPAGVASAASPLTIASSVALPGTPPAGRLSPPVAAEASDGTVYVGALTGAGQTVYSVSPGGALHLLDKVTGVGAITAIAADATNVYVGSHLAVSEYARSNGKLVRRWVLSPTPRGLSQLVVAGNRVWGLLTPLGIHRAPSSLVELDPTQQARVATVNGVADTLSIAATATGIEYVTNKSSTLVRRTNTGAVTNTPTLLAVNLTLSGPAAIQAEVISGSTLFVKFAAGQGLDAVTYTYNATTLAGPLGPNVFSADATLGPTSLGTLAAGAAGELPCTSTLNPCLVRYGAQGATGAVLSLPYEFSSAPLGPKAALVVTKGLAQRLLRIG